MKTLAATTLAAIAAAVTAVPLTANNVETESISADAKWLLHINLDVFRETEIGSFLFDAVIKPRAGEKPMGFRIKTEDIYEGIHAITAYGTNYQVDSDSIGVLLVRTEPNLRSIFEATLIQQEAAGGENPNVTTVQTDPYPIYALRDGLYAAILPEEVIVISKSLNQLANAVDVVEDRSPGLDESESAIARMPKAQGSFFFLATAEGFNQSAAIPPQARVLQLAQAARLVLGEGSEDLFLDLTLKAANEKLRDQLAKIVQGLLALLSLSQIENQDLAELAQSTEVDRHGNDVTVAFNYPIDRVLEWVQSAAPTEDRPPDPVPDKDPAETTSL